MINVERPHCVRACTVLAAAIQAIAGLAGSAGVAVAQVERSQARAPDDWHIPDLSGPWSTSGANVKYIEVADALAVRGTEYRIRVPENWNGTLISDLDYHRAADSPRYLHLLEEGNALSGTLRRPDRLLNYDPAHEIHDLVSVLDVFESRFGEPARTIQYGCSGGGNVATGMAEIRPDRIDGAITAGSPTSPWFANTHLDGFFVLKALIAPDLPIVNLPLTDPEISEIGTAWEQAINDAQTTPEGRARIALAVTIGQWPAWGGTFGDQADAPVPEPDPNDASALQESMYHGVLAVLPSPGTFGHSMLEHAAPGMLRWNTGVDYRQSFRNGNAAYREAVEALYREAGLDLASDIDRINAFPRIEADPSAVKWWSAPGRTHVGEPKVPLLRLHNNGDLLVYASQVQGYEALAQEKGYGALFRSAYVRRAGHCTYNQAEFLAVLETMMQRLDTGAWPGTDPRTLNELGTSLDPANPPQFYDYQGVSRYNRVWLPGTVDFLGGANATP